MADLFDWRAGLSQGGTLTAWKPEPLGHGEWPPNYKGVYAWRIKTLKQLRSNPQLLAGAKEYYRRNKGEFIIHWMDTYDPRKTGIKWMPFVFFQKQSEVIQMFEQLRVDQESGLIEKCRDAGVTWLACGYSVACFLFNTHDSIGWGSRKAMLVDELGNPDSIFEKMRLIVRRLPKEFLPNGWDDRKHTSYMKFINPENGSSINGEAGDNIGRGGRKSLYFVDEAAHLERPEKIEAALGDNTRVRIDISSVNGLGNVFHKRRVAGIDWRPGKPVDPGYTRVLVLDWRDHPEKTQEWYDQRRARYEREGMLHLFAQEVDRDYAASVSNVIIPKQWIMSAIDAHLKLGWPDGGNWMAGLDVADGGIDRNGLVTRQGLVARTAEEWGERDPGVTTRRTAVALRGLGRCRVMYDSIGVGSAVKAEYNRLTDDGTLSAQHFPFVSWNAGAGVLDPAYRVIPDDDGSITNGDMFKNLKAQAWWSARTRFYKTWRMIEALEGRGDPVEYPLDELVSLDSRMPLLYQLIDELAQPVKKETSRLQMVVDKQPDGMKSPNLGDSFVMCYFPVEAEQGAMTVQGGL